MTKKKLNQTYDRQRIREAKRLEKKLSKDWIPVPNPNPDEYAGLEFVESTWKNNTYLVMIEPDEYEGERVDHLWIQRHDGRPERDWEQLQVIKNELCHPLREGVEFYPNEALKINERNIYHIYVLPFGVELPFGMQKAMDRETRVLKETLYN